MISKEAKAIISRRYYIKNRERILREQHEWLADPENKKKHAQYCSTWRKRNMKAAAIYNRNWLAKNPEKRKQYAKPGNKDKHKLYRQRHPIIKRAHYAVAGAKRRGELVRQPCEVCGEPNTQAHHENYRKPLDVRWLCHKHHKELHRKYKEGFNVTLQNFGMGILDKPY